ncbi:MAG TPA: 30S ribosomal protein S12, partial [Methanosarcina sp.]|nr:30S ribosomal protein S12 [Methanosarcina sp.]
MAKGKYAANILTQNRKNARWKDSYYGRRVLG